MKKLILISLVAIISMAASAQEYMNVNGQYYPVSKLKSFTYGMSTTQLPDVMERDGSLSLFCQALRTTHIADSLYAYSDKNYSVGADSTTWTNPNLVTFVAMEYDNVAYMPKRYKKFTVFAVQDAVLQEKYGVTTLDGLRTLAHSLYDEMYPEDKSINDETDRRNALNRFISYHILPFEAHYYQLTGEDGMTMSANWDRNLIDIADWYETLMPHSLLKCSFPSGGRETMGLYVNRRGVKAGADGYGVFVRGSQVANPDTYDKEHQTLNGYYHYIDDIIYYNKQTQQTVLAERMRINCSTLSPDFMTSGAHGHAPEGRRYGTWDTDRTINNRNQCIGFKSGSAENFWFNDEETHLHVRNRVPSFWSYAGDELALLGNFDIKVKLPSLPAGKYELRLGTCVDFSTRAICQFYIDDQSTGIPVDFRMSAIDLFGWKGDSGDEETDAENDKQYHELGWMKGPDSYYSATFEDGGTKASNFRSLSRTVRKIIGQFETNGKDEHTLRIKNVGGGYHLDFDYIELVPSSIYDNPDIPEDRH